MAVRGSENGIQMVLMVMPIAAIEEEGQVFPKKKNLRRTSSVLCAHAS
jgi:hypothetical protein